jgi:hypothetical protein
VTSASTITLKRGSLYFGSEVHNRFFSGLEAIILLRRGDDLAILPVRHAAAGGYVLKRRNSAGDRIVHAPDFFREHGIDDQVERELAVSWSTAASELTAEGVFLLQS